MGLSSSAPSFPRSPGFVVEGVDPAPLGRVLRIRAPCRCTRRRCFSPRDRPLKPTLASGTGERQICPLRNGQTADHDIPNIDSHSPSAARGCRACVTPFTLSNADAGHKCLTPAHDERRNPLEIRDENHSAGVFSHCVGSPFIRSAKVVVGEGMSCVGRYGGARRHRREKPHGATQRATLQRLLDGRPTVGSASLDRRDVHGATAWRRRSAFRK